MQRLPRGCCSSISITHSSDTEKHIKSKGDNAFHEINNGLVCVSIGPIYNQKPKNTIQS